VDVLKKINVNVQFKFNIYSLKVVVKSHTWKGENTSNYKQLIQLLLKGIEENRKGKFNTTEFINLICDMMLKHIEELDELVGYIQNYI